MTKYIVGELRALKVRHILHLDVKSPHGHVNSVRIHAAEPLGNVAAGELVMIGGLEGFPESRHTIGKVRKVSHSFTGGPSDFEHTTIVHIDETDVSI